MYIRRAVKTMPPPRVPLWLKLGYGIGTPVIAAIYARTYGPKNFLWLSDIALAATTAAVLTESPLLASMPAAGVLPLELAWTADFLAGGKMLHLAHYMYDRDIPAGRRALSLFHLALPPTLLWLMHRLGYDRRALALQTALTLAVLPITHAITEPEKNINWTFGPGDKPQRRLPPLLYLALEMAFIPALVIWPTHKLLSRFFKKPG